MNEGPPEHPLARAERLLAVAQSDPLVTRKFATGKPRTVTREDIIRGLNTMHRNGEIDEHGNAVNIPTAFRRPPTTTSPTKEPEDQP